MTQEVVVQLLRVAFASTYPPVHCGVGEYTRFLLVGLESIMPSGEYYVLASSDVGEGYFDGAVSARIIPSFVKKDPPSFKGILNTLAEVGGVDVLHVQHEYGIFGGYEHLLEVLDEAKQERLTKAVVVTMHSVYHPFTGREDALVFQYGLRDHADAVIVHSIVQEFELRAQGVSPRKIYRIPHGTLLNPYLGYPRPKLAERLGIDCSSLHGLIVVFMGFLRWDKGLDVLADALSLLDDNYKVTVVAGGEVRDSRVGALAHELSEMGHVFIEKYLTGEEILMLASIADAILLPYKDRPGVLSVSGILHLSMGSLKPMIGSAVPRLIELYQYAPRFTVKPDSPEELAAKIRWLINNYELAVAYASTLYAYAIRTQWIRMARRHLALYRALLCSGQAAQRSVNVHS